jgi:hypothetical protein
MSVETGTKFMSHFNDRLLYRRVTTHHCYYYVPFVSDLSIRLAVESYGNHQECDTNDASKPE